MSQKPVLGIYRHTLLNRSETFILNQAEALRYFVPHYLGMRRADGLRTPSERTTIADCGGWRGSAEEKLAMLGFNGAFTRKIQSHQPQLIHAHFGIDGAIALPLSQQLDVPLLVTFHGYDITVKDGLAQQKLGQYLYKKRRARLKRDASGFIAVSEFIQKKLLEQGFPPNKIHLHYIGINTQLFKPKQSIQREPIVLFVGRLVEKKGCEYLIKALSNLQPVLPNVKLVIIGDGPLRNSLEQIAEKQLKHCLFLGAQPPEVVREWMSRSTVFSVPSITAKDGDTEGFGLVFTEAQAIGLPVVSFASGGIPEAVSHEETGLLVPERDVDRLAHSLRLLIENEEVRSKFGQAGIERVNRLFNLERQTKLLEALYHRTIQQFREVSR